MGNNTLLILAVFFILVTGCTKQPTSETQGQCKLDYQALDKSDSDPMIRFALQRQSELSGKPDKLKDMPKNISGNVHYYYARIADQNIPLIINYAKECTLYVDTDFDGNLSDERCFNRQSIKDGRLEPTKYYRFGPISIKLKHSDIKVSTTFYVIAPLGTNNDIHLYPAGYRKGKIRIGQKDYNVALIDSNYDGLYDKRISLPVDKLYYPGCDSFFLDKNMNKKVDFSFDQYSELTPLTRMIILEDEYYNIDINPLGTAFKLDRVVPECGIMDLCGANIQLTLWSTAAEQSFLSFQDEYQLPEGQYFASYLNYEKTDSQKNRWTAHCYKNSGDLYNFEIRSQERKQFKIGSPFQIKAVVTPGNNTLIKFYLEGIAGEQYSSEIKMNGKSISAPKIKIVDQSGNVLETGEFKFGGGGICNYSWRVSDSFKGKYQIRVEMESGPFEIKQDETWYEIK
jgi:hypothetical protein